MEKLFELLKIFFEKHLIPTVLSIIIGILSVGLVPKDNLLLLRVGDSIFGLLIGCIAFVLIEFIIWIFKLIQNHLEHIENSQARIEENKFNEMQSLENLWSFVDKLSISDYDYLINFLKSNNKPIVFSNRIFLSESLFNTQYVEVSICRSDNKNPNNANNEISLNTTAFNLFELSGTKKQYRLTSDFFNLLKYSYEKYNKISHFER
jgi:hypothetical protein